MPITITRTLLQVVYLEAVAAARTPNTLREVLGLLCARAQNDYTPRDRKILDIRGPAPLIDNPSRRQLELRNGGSKVISTTVPLAQDNFNEPGWDDCEVVLVTCTEDAVLTGLSAFSCRRWAKLFVNVGAANALTLSQENDGSLADNRLVTTATIGPHQACWVIRDSESNRWRTSKGAVLEVVPDAGSLWTNAAGEANPTAFTF